MRTIFSKLIFLPCLFSLISCREVVKEDSETITSEHDYEEIKDREIAWNDIFTIDIPQYFVYFYSPNCSHCKEIKNVIIEYALEDGNMYFVRFSDEVVVSFDIKNTIGITSIDELSILGTPSLIEIIDNVLISNIAGSKAILNYLEIPFPN